MPRHYTNWNARNKNHMKSYLIFVLILSFHVVVSQSSAELEKQMKSKAESFISRMTLKEKIAQLMNAAPGIERLGIKRNNFV